MLGQTVAAPAEADVGVPASIFRKLGRETALYGFAGIVGRIASVALLPVYTRYLTPAEYGILALLDIAVEITSILFSAGMRAGLQRFYFKAAIGREREEVVFTAWALELTLSIGGAIALTLLAPLLHQWVMAGTGTPSLIRIAALSFALASATNVPMALLQMEGRAGLYAGLLLARMALQISFNTLFLVHFHLGVAAMLWGTIVATTVMVAILGWYVLSRVAPRVNMVALNNLRRFGLPYQVATAAAFILAFGDRFFLLRWHGAAVVGLYGLAYQFGFLLYQVSTAPFLRAWDPQRHMMVAWPRQERDAGNARGFLYFNLLVITMATGIVLFAKPVIVVLTSNTYHSAATLVPLIVAAYVVQSWGDATKIGIDVSEQTKLFTYASWAATVVVIALYALLIPPLAGFGAALATLIAFVVRFGLGYYWSQRVWPIAYGWAPVIRVSAIAVIIVEVGLRWAPTKPLAQFGYSTLLTLLYAGCVWTLALHRAERSSIIQLLRSRALSPA